MVRSVRTWISRTVRTTEMPTIQQSSQKIVSKNWNSKDRNNRSSEYKCKLIDPTSTWCTRCWHHWWMSAAIWCYRMTSGRWWSERKNVEYIFLSTEIKEKKKWDRELDSIRCVTVTGCVCQRCQYFDLVLKWLVPINCHVNCSGWLVDCAASYHLSTTWIYMQKHIQITYMRPYNRTLDNGSCDTNLSISGSQSVFSFSAKPYKRSLFMVSMRLLVTLPMVAMAVVAVVLVNVHALILGRGKITAVRCNLSFGRCECVCRQFHTCWPLWFM